MVLVDEYDKALIDHLGKGEEKLQLAIDNRDALKGLFGVLKGGDIVPLLRLVFITGVSRFSRVSIFSELNNLNDLSMDERYADIVGVTSDELAANFEGHISRLAGKLKLSDEAACQRLADLYNGYRFTQKPTQVFNPYCLLQALDRQKLEDYWFGSGSPSFLVRLLKEREFPPLELEGVEADASEFDRFDMENLGVKGLLFQTGYLTIRDYDDDDGIYTLGFPNEEVRTGFYKKLLFADDAYSLPQQKTTVALSLRRLLDKEDLEGFAESVNALFASLPYQQGARLNESQFHALFYMMLAMSGMRVQCELLTSRGRIDLALEFADKVYVIELKCGQSADAALKQIEEKGYLERYAGSRKKRIALGIDFDAEKRCITEWKHDVVAKSSA